MKPVLRAATVVTALTVSYGMTATTPATAEVPAGIDAAGGAAASRAPYQLPYRDTGEPTNSADWKAAHRTKAPAHTTVAAPATTVAPQSPATTEPAKPYDINGDSYADVAIGAPGEDLGPDTNAGMLHVLWGRSTGVTTSGDRVIHQDTTGVPGSPEDGDLFAWTNTSGDFNADGYADIAVSTILEDIGTAADAGLVQVFYGSATGLRTSGVTGLEIPRTGMALGVGLAAGDFNGDGRDDLAAGGPGYSSSFVFVFNGTDTGLSTTYQEFMQGANGVPGTPGSEDYFGEALSAGDINSDGISDLAIGASGDWDDLGWPTGSVTILYGSTSGLNGAGGAQRFSKETPEVPGDGGWYDESNGDYPDSFGYELALGDFNADGRADLAVGAPGAAVNYDGIRKMNAGTLTVLYSNGTAIGTAGAVEVTQATAGIPGVPGHFDWLGDVVTAGDANGDGAWELATFSEGDGYVTVVPGSSTGLVYGSAKGWTQDSPGIPGVPEDWDLWGNSLQFQGIKGTGRHSLIVGANGENNFRGAFTVIHSTSTGLTGTGAQAFSQDTYGVEGTAEPDDNFGAIY
jgi:hypothetical protein